LLEEFFVNSCCSKHPDHSPQTAALNGASGQINGIKKMIDERQYCPDILTQLRAVRAALKSIEAKMLEAHLTQCVCDAMKSNDEDATNKKIQELVQLFKRFED